MQYFMAIWSQIVPANHITLSERLKQLGIKDESRFLNAVNGARFFQRKNSPNYEVSPGNIIRALSWNVNYRSETRKVIEILHKPLIRVKPPDIAEPDIILLQEVKPEGDGINSILHEIEKSGRFDYVYGTESFKLNGEANPIQIGNAVLSRYGISDYKILRLNSDGFLCNPRYKEGELGNGLAVRAVVEIRGKKYAVYSAHLELYITPEQRRLQLKKIFDDANSLELPAIIGGDFNFLIEGRSGKTSRFIKKQGFDDPFGVSKESTINDGLTAIAHAFLPSGGALDRMLSRGIMLRNHRVLNSNKASDHYQIFAEYFLL